MSYRPDEQALQPHIEMILKGISGLRKAFYERIKSGDWLPEHLGQVEVLSRELLRYEIKLMELKSRTW